MVASSIARVDVCMDVNGDEAIYINGDLVDEVGSVYTIDILQAMQKCNVTGPIILNQWTSEFHVPEWPKRHSDLFTEFEFNRTE